MGNFQCETIACCQCSGPGNQPLLPEEAKNKGGKVRHPFPTLPSFQIALHILCYLGHSDEVAALLNLLCCNTQTYLRRHRDTLESFLVAWVPPTISCVIKFGK